MNRPWALYDFYEFLLWIELQMDESSSPVLIDLFAPPVLQHSVRAETALQGRCVPAVHMILP